MKNLRTIIILLAGAALTACSKQQVSSPEVKKTAGRAMKISSTPSDKVVVAYIAGSAGNVQAITDSIDFSIVTHVNLAFFDPGTNGEMMANGEPLFADFTAQQINYVVTKAHAAGRKVLPSLVGANPAAGSGNIVELFRPANRTNFINHLADMVTYFNLDGVDVDVEGNQLAAIKNEGNYAGFIAALRNKINPLGKLVTVATPGPNSTTIPNSSIAYFDLVNIMSYDIGYGTSNNHSPYNKAVDDIQYYISNGWPASKLVLGLPAYGFKPTVGTGTRSYKSIVAEYGSAAAYADEYNGYKYNGINTIEAKTQYAVENIKGVMLWELSQDAPGPYNLIRAVGRKINPSAP